MKVLVVGNGGREAAFAWKMAQSSLVQEIIIHPYHPAAKLLHAKINTIDSDLETCLKEKFDLAVIGPEAPLSEGLADRMRLMGIPVVGPSKAASQLETSKAFGKEIMEKASVPTAASATFTSLQEAIAFLELCPWKGFAVKADGLTQGKGVIVADTKTEAAQALKALMSGEHLGALVEKILIEEKLTGPELSAFALCDGENFVTLGYARDHKRLQAGDLGPNTGGMGALTVELSEEDKRTIDENVFRPILKTMKSQGMPFQGFLFAGLMNTPDGFKVLEFNVRMGDPETQALMPHIQSDIVPYFLAAARGEIAKMPMIEFHPGISVHTVLAAPGYPGVGGEKVQLGDEVVWTLPTSGTVFPAGLTLKNEKWVSRGGRILGFTVIAPDLRSSREQTEKTMKSLAFKGSQWRADIGGDLC